MKRVIKKTEETILSFLQLQAAGGIVLVIAAVVAIVIANSPLYGFYDYALHDVKFGFDLFGSSIEKSVLHWINDGLMVIFFFIVGLEIKQEIVQGGLSSRAKALLPLLAAVGGMVVPALIYIGINAQTPENLPGWAIPSATDIAFSLGVLSLLGTRIPLSLKVLLTAIAIIDDLGAILIIAFFYSGALDFQPLYFGISAILFMLALNIKGAVSIPSYLILGVVLWLAVLQSGIHATLAGVITAFFIPVRDPKNSSYCPSKETEHFLHPWVAFGILPLFAFANAGVPFAGMGLHSLFDPTALGIILGLFIGKQIGIFGVIWAVVKLKISPMPEGTNWGQLYGMAILCGIGFTMSLFIGGLAFDDLRHQADIRLGVLVGSVLSAVVGYWVLHKFSVKQK